MKVNAAALVAIRTRTGLSQSELARRTDIDRTQLNHLEAGRRGGTPAQLRKLADALSVPLDAIVIFTETAA
jgi:transcriptional regulator with XRE-family HTH domain